MKPAKPRYEARTRWAPARNPVTGAETAVAPATSATGDPYGRPSTANWTFPPGVPSAGGAIPSCIVNRGAPPSAASGAELLMVPSVAAGSTPCVAPAAFAKKLASPP